MNRPRIGITTSLNRTDSGAREQRVDLAYVRAVERAGGLPMIVPMLATDEATDAFAELLDGLVVTGGPAVTDGLVGLLPDDIDETDPDRVSSDARLLGAFLDARRPALGVCYGMQLASSLRGGTIYADVQRQLDGASVHSSKRGGTEHEVGIVAGTHLHRLVEADRLVVNTRHVQAVAELGAGLVVAARAPDGVVEALESEDGSFIGVQFHPEAMSPPLDSVFTDLVTRASHFRS